MGAFERPGARGLGRPTTASSRASTAGCSRRLLPQARFELVEGSRTFIPEDRPEPLVALLREFLAAA